VGTGEGKSLIIAMLAAYYVMKGCSRVNVLVDNLSLLERDFSTFDALFRELGISACSAANQQTVEPSVQVPDPLTPFTGALPALI
jgi:preprotein translocase subunit SecA